MFMQKLLMPMSQRDIFSDDVSVIAQSAYTEIESRLWATGFTRIAGVDEVGRGPLAGPVVACACILPSHVIFPSVRDSKALSECERKAVYQELTSHPHVSFALGIV